VGRSISSDIAQLLGARPCSGELLLLLPVELILTHTRGAQQGQTAAVRPLRKALGKPS
jgi:hypothetical protein